jgi:hypothetical protein
MISLYIDTSSSFISRVSLDNAIYYVKLSFSTREQSWYLTLLDVSRKVITEGVKLQFGVSPTRHLIDNPLNGNLYISRSSSRVGALGRNNFGQDLDYSLVYITSAEEPLYITEVTV